MMELYHIFCLFKIVVVFNSGHFVPVGRLFDQALDEVIAFIAMDPRLKLAGMTGL
jgi:hypothetical protein